MNRRSTSFRHSGAVKLDSDADNSNICATGTSFSIKVLSIRSHSPTWNTLVSTYLLISRGGYALAAHSPSINDSRCAYKMNLIKWYHKVEWTEPKVSSSLFVFFLTCLKVQDWHHGVNTINCISARSSERGWGFVPEVDWALHSHILQAWTVHNHSSVDGLQE